jgi:hypothetical protein
MVAEDDDTCECEYCGKTTYTDEAEGCPICGHDCCPDCCCYDEAEEMYVCPECVTQEKRLA